MGILVVTRQVAGHWGGTASGVVASGLWQRLVRLHHDGLRLERRRPSGKGVLSSGMAVILSFLLLIFLPVSLSISIHMQYIHNICRKTFTLFSFP